MSVRGFMEFVEIRTKAASVIPFLLGTVYALHRFRTFHLKNFVLMLVSLLCIDMATTAINNYMDEKRACKKRGETHPVAEKYGFGKAAALAVIFALLLVAAAFGLLLFLNTDFVVLALGAVSFAVGVLYSFGPVPISRTPFGELFSGAFMGVLIPFLAFYIQTYHLGLLRLAFQGGVFRIAVNLPEVFYVVLVSLPAAVGIANIMLANNICDMREDAENGRYTLPTYLGKNNALKVFGALYYSGYLALAVLLATGVVPPVCILVFGTFVLVRKRIRAFREKQSKKETFVLSVQNFVLMNGALVLTLAVSVAAGGVL
ncbi:1,4-dihydroxy-2-naphthoate polyprenyltransferase [Clostridium sp. W14A]|nr:1,4-dihydroxy-2-naphthoate polyprenyltransferase [Clostridium sp. W14A]